jgi:hypothetical protein
MDVFYEGYTFRLALHYPRELMLLEVRPRRRALFWSGARAMR